MMFTSDNNGSGHGNLLFYYNARGIQENSSRVQRLGTEKSAACVPKFVKPSAVITALAHVETGAIVVHFSFSIMCTWMLERSWRASSLLWGFRANLPPMPLSKQRNPNVSFYFLNPEISLPPLAARTTEQPMAIIVTGKLAREISVVASVATKKFR
eukprot:gb/GEZJ01004601.1/.p2 GENE.gb/GEZJ01004601.1/~~gb/GEZJ01004601.1/.p2  ORF type:complete len:156 (-),score=15.66 gb/GEZJ01004601.1/:2414-2881(-)